MRTRTEPESIPVEGAKFDRSIKIGGSADVDALKIIIRKLKDDGIIEGFYENRKTVPFSIVQKSVEASDAWRVPFEARDVSFRFGNVTAHGPRYNPSHGSGCPKVARGFRQAASY